MKITRQGHSAIVDLNGVTRVALVSSELRAKAQEMLALADALESLPVMTPQFDNVSCSQCGRSFGPGDSGFSHCRNHASIHPV